LLVKIVIVFLCDVMSNSLAEIQSKALYYQNWANAHPFTKQEPANTNWWAKVNERSAYVATLSPSEYSFFMDVWNQNFHAVEDQIDAEMEAERKAHEWETWTGVLGFGLAGAALTPVISSVFAEPAVAATTGYVAGAEGDIAALAMENQAIAGPAVSAASPEFSAFALQAESEFLAPEAVGLAAEPSFWDKLYSAGKSAVGGVGTASNVYSALTKEVQDVQNILSPVFQSDYPTVADRTGSQEYTKIEDQDRVLGSESPFSSFFGTAEDELVDGETGSSSLVIVGGVVLLLLFLRR